MALKLSPNGFAIRITSDEGDMYVRDGDQPGEGPVSKFATMQEALTMVEACRPGFEPDMFPAVVPFDAVPESER
jgi:hypothetical protein